MHFTQRINQIFTGNPDGNFAHSTLRTVFDWPANEWKDTTMDEKVEILRTLVNGPDQLLGLIMDYMENNQELRPDTAKPLTILWSLTYIIEYLLKDEPAADE